MSSTSATTDDTSSSSSSGGLMGALGGLMKLADPQLLISVGAGLMSGARYGSNAGEGLLQGLSAYHQMKSGDLQNQLQRQQLQEGQLGLQQRQMMLGAAQQAFQGGPGQPQPTPGAPPAGGAGAPTSTPFLPGISQMPADGSQPAQQAPSPQAGLPASLQPPSMAQIYGTTYPGGASPNYTRGMALLSQDPAAALLKARDDQLKLAQQQYAPTIAKLDTLIKSDTPSKYMKADPDLTAAWPQLATTLGMDPDKDYNDQNVRLALTHVRNQISSSLSEATEAPVNQMRTVTLGDGRTAQIDPVTGKQTVEAPSPLEKVVDPRTGQPTLVPAGRAAGMTPFNPSIYGAANITDQSREMAYQYYLQHQALPPGFSKSPAMNADMMNFIAQRAQQDGNSQTSILANKQLLQARQGAEKSFAPGGKDYTTTQSINTAISHLAVMDDLGKALGNNANSQTLSRVKNAVSTEFGGTAPTSVAAAAQIVGSEVTKAIVANGGSSAERDEAARQFSTAKTYPQFKAAIDTYTQLLGGQLETKRNSYQQSLGRDDFDTKFLTPRTRAALGIPEPAAGGKVGGTGVTLTPGQSHSVGGFTVTRTN